MSYGKRRRPDARSASGPGSIQRRVAPGKRTRTGRLSSEGLAPGSVAVSSAPSEAEPRTPTRAMVGPGYGSPVPPLGEMADWYSDDASDSAPLQRQGAVRDMGGADAVHGVLLGHSLQERATEGVAGPGSTLPHRALIQSAFGHHDVAGIEAHVGGLAAGAAADIGADAYATGNRVAFASAPDLHTAAHEAAHVVQQRGGVQLSGGVGREGDAFETHADVVADRVVHGESAAALIDQVAGGGFPSNDAGGTIQRKPNAGSQTADAPNRSNPSDALDPYQMYKTWLDMWSSRSAQALPRVADLEDKIRSKNPADYADKMDMFSPRAP